MTLIEMTVTGALMILGVIVLRAVTLSRVPKRAFIIMWEIALLRLLLPVSVPVKILPAVQTVMPQISAVESAVTEPMSQEVVLRIPEEVMEFIPNSTPAVVSAPAAAPNTPEFTVTPEMIWIAGAVLLALFFTVSYIRGTLRFRGATPCESEFIREWLAVHPLERPLTVKVSRAVSSPLTYGILNPTILIPPEYEKADECALELVLEHEYAHIRHFDALKKLICTAALCVHWFNPMMWVLYLLYNRDMELWCDESVIKKFGAGSRSQYARLLISIEEQRSVGAPLLSHFGSLFKGFGKSTTEERIVSIMKFKKATFITICIAVLLVAAITVTIIATSVDPIPKDPEPISEVNEVIPAETDSPIIVGDESMPEDGDVTWGGWIGDTESHINDHHGTLPPYSRIVISDEGEPYQFEEGEEAVVTFVLAESPKGRFEYGYQKNMSSEGDTYYDPQDVPLGGFSDRAVSFVFTAPESGKYWFFITNTTYEAVSVRTAQVSRQTSPLHTDAELYVFPGENANRYISDTLRARRQVMQAGVTNEQIHNIVTDGVSEIKMSGHHFEVGDRAIVVYDFRHPVTEEEAQMEVNYLVEQCDGDHDDGINGGEQTARYNLTNSFIYDNTCLVFTFIAPETADYYFNGGTPLDRDFYVAGVWVAVETEPYKFGSMTIGEEFFSEHTEYQWKSISSKTMSILEYYEQILNGEVEVPDIIPYSRVITLSDGEEKLIGPYAEPEDLMAEIERFCKESVANGRMTQADYDEIMEDYAYYYMTPQERQQWYEEQRNSSLREGYFEMYKGYSRLNHPAAIPADGSLCYIENIYRDNEPVSEAKNGSIYLKKGDRAAIVAYLDMSCEVFAADPENYLRICQDVLTIGFTLNGTNYAMNINSAWNGSNGAGVNVFFIAPEDGEYSFFFSNSGDSEISLMDGFAAMQSADDPENCIYYMNYDGTGGGGGISEKSFFYKELTALREQLEKQKADLPAEVEQAMRDQLSKNK